jgi:hypothetical protein
LVQDFVSGRVRPVIQYHYESRQQRVLVQLVHTTGKTWYKVLYHHTMYVISLSNISVKTNVKQITTVQLHLTILHNTLSTTLCTWRRVISCFHSPKSRYCSITLSVTVKSSNNAFLCGEMWIVHLPEILKLCFWKWK